MKEENANLPFPEVGLLLLFFVASTFMYIESYSFPSEVGRFPQITSFVVVIGSVALLGKRFIPDSIMDLLPDASTGSSGLGSMTDDFEVNENEPEGDSNYDAQIRFGGLMVLYVVSSWLVGLIWTTPAFVALYLYLTDKPWYTVVALTIVSYSIAVLFGLVMSMDVQSGVML